MVHLLYNYINLNLKYEYNLKENTHGFRCIIMVVPSLTLSILFKNHSLLLIHYYFSMIL